MEKLERAGAKRSVVGLVVPTGYSFNLDGTNIYMTLAALFIAQACGIDLSLGDQNPDGSIMLALYNEGGAGNISVSALGKTIQFAGPARGWATVNVQP